MSVFPPGETTRTCRLWATASRPEQPVSSNARCLLRRSPAGMASSAAPSGRSALHRRRRGQSAAGCEYTTSTRRSPSQINDVTEAARSPDGGSCQRRHRSDTPQRPHRQLMADAHQFMAGADTCLSTAVVIRAAISTGGSPQHGVNGLVPPPIPRGSRHARHRGRRGGPRRSWPIRSDPGLSHRKVMPGGDGRGGLLARCSGRCDYRHDVARQSATRIAPRRLRIRVESGQPPARMPVG